MTAMAIQHIGRTRAAIEAQDIAFRLGIEVADVTLDHRWHFAVGFMDDGASSVVWLRNYVCPAPLPEWPAEPFDLIAQGEDQ